MALIRTRIVHPLESQRICYFGEKAVSTTRVIAVGLSVTLERMRPGLVYQNGSVGSINLHRALLTRPGANTVFRVPLCNFFYRGARSQLHAPHKSRVGDLMANRHIARRCPGQAFSLRNPSMQRYL